MKKLILLVAFAFLSCTTNDEINKCTIIAQLESKSTYYEKNNVVISQVEWQNENDPFLYGYDCSDDGKIIEYAKEVLNNKTTEYRLRLYKKQ